jgi:hypothetical protein
MATLAVVGALVMRASVGHLESTPATYGRTWTSSYSTTRRSWSTTPQLNRLGVVKTGPIPLDGWPVNVRGVTSLKGPAPILVVDGRPPERGEIVLGRRTMVDLGVRIGDSFVARGERTLRVVGESSVRRDHRRARRRLRRRGSTRRVRSPRSSGRDRRERRRRPRRRRRSRSLRGAGGVHAGRAAHGGRGARRARTSARDRYAPAGSQCVPRGGRSGRRRTRLGRKSQAEMDFTTPTPAHLEWSSCSASSSRASTGGGGGS